MLYRSDMAFVHSLSGWSATSTLVFFSESVVKIRCSVGFVVDKSTDENFSLRSLLIFRQNAASG